MIAKEWDGAEVRRWLERRLVAARADQAIAERAGRGGQDDCDKATAEEMVCSLMNRDTAVATRDAFADGLRILLDRDDYVWRGVHDDIRFDRHVRSLIRRLIRMTKANSGFENVAHYQ